MDMSASLPTMDVTGTIDVSDPFAVCAEVKAILEKRYPDADFCKLDRLYADFAALYRGQYPGFYACDTAYHDLQHVLDVSLATARILDGYEIRHSHDPLGAELALIAIVVALFHDSGYIRARRRDKVSHGAEYTKIHVSRSADFMAHYLPEIDLGGIVPLVEKLVHFTGYEIHPDQIAVNEPKHRLVGCLVGTADVIAQMSDAAYLEKCRDRLYPEFVLGGIARQRLADGSEQVIYSSAEDLLLKTPEFIRSTIAERLDGYFNGLYHYAADHFDGRNLYMDALECNCRYLEKLLAHNDPSLLRKSLVRPAHRHS